MSTKMCREAYEKIVTEDLQWLLAQPKTLERDHIAEIVRLSPIREYAGFTPDATALREAEGELVAFDSRDEGIAVKLLFRKRPLMEIVTGAKYRVSPVLLRSEPREPANLRNPCGDCKMGIGTRPDAICDECENDALGMPSMWKPREESND